MAVKESILMEEADGHGMSISLDTLAQLYYVLCATFVALFLISYSIMKNGRKKRSNSGHVMRKPTHFLDKRVVDDRCEICFGKIEDEVVMECDCGRSYHKDCAGKTNECPYCKTPYDEMKQRPIRKGKCCRCGESLYDNVCPRCNTVTPWENGTFKCVCGHELYITDGRCPECGALYRNNH